MQHTPTGILGEKTKTIIMLRENREHWRPIYFSINLVDSFEQLQLHFYCTAICISWPQNCLWKVAHNKHDRGNSVESLAPVALCLVTAPHPWWRVSITNIIGFWHFSIQQDIDPLSICVSLILAFERQWSDLQNQKSKTTVQGHPRCVTKQMTCSVSG